jgi:hypothetical protein
LHFRFFPLLSARHLSLRVLLHLSVCMFSVFVQLLHLAYLIITSGLFAVTSLSLCTAGFHNSVTSSCSYTGLGGCRCVCVYNLPVVSKPRALQIE